MATFDLNQNLFSSGQLGGAINSMPMAGSGGGPPEKPCNIIAAGLSAFGLNVNSSTGQGIFDLLPGTAQGRSWLEQNISPWGQPRKQRDTWITSGHQALFSDNKAGCTWGQGSPIEASASAAPDAGHPDIGPSSNSHDIAHHSPDPGLHTMDSMRHQDITAPQISDPQSPGAHVGHIASSEGTGQTPHTPIGPHPEFARFDIGPLPDFGRFIVSGGNDNFIPLAPVARGSGAGGLEVG